WDFLVDRTNKIAQVRIASFNHGTTEELCAVLNRLTEEGVRGVVLDLRWCPGGFLDEAVGAAGLFLGECVVATVQTRNGQPTKYHNTAPGRFTKLPLVVLVNGSTSGGAELVAAALQDHGRAKVAGQRSRGKASVQTALYSGLPGATIKL